MKGNTLKGILLVGIGAASYGILATFVKMANNEGFTTAEVTFAQAFLGFAILAVMNLATKSRRLPQARANTKDKLKLMLAGTSMGLTSVFYYLSVRYVSVSICIVLLMQAVWMGVLLESILEKKRPSAQKVIAVVIVLAGTLLATDLLRSQVVLDWRGIGFGLLAAVAYSVSIYASQHIATERSPLQRSLFLLCGAVIIVTLIWGPSLLQQFNPVVLWRWGIILSVFGTVLPPLMFTKGMPITGVGLGSIIASVEIPVSVLMAHFLLHETVNTWQWTGIAMILMAIALMNLRFRAQLE
ncbi:EamA family transporter [Chitinophaga barathri]|uniref:EamA/RhaT family transporter n=1 Tax=Chitinophaga barathri TaxID=1647451 RepID=A0A3N4MJF7_9BACT|nr:DMT family transporter [Chitinophaga barathri]RPD41987.1 EamA/RhaT family transporter [Chitinophaga barathri]